MPFSPDSLQVHFRFLTAQVYVFLKRNSPSPFCATYIFLDVKPSTKTWWTYQDHTLKENAIFSFSGYQSPVPPGLGMRLCVPISSLHAGILSDVISHRSCLLIQPPWVLLCSCPLCVENTAFLSSPTVSVPCSLSYCFSATIPEP